MNTKCKKIIVIAIFLLFSFYHMILSPFTGAGINAETEKREINQRPQFFLQNYETYAREYEAYYDDYIPYRTKLTRLLSEMKLKLKTSPSESVVLGKDGWLFYNSKKADLITDTLLDYSGELYTQEQLSNITKEISLAYEFCKERGIKFVFLIGPNKSNIYDEYMNSSYTRSDSYTRTDQLVDYIKNNSEIPYVYPKEELNKYKNELPLYFKTDTHWNELGGYIAAKEILQKCDVTVLPSVTDLKYEKYGFSGDLVNLLGVTDYTEDYYIDIDEEFCADLELLDFDSDRNKYEYQSSNTNGKNLLILGDSFAEAILKPLGNQYTNTTYLKSRYYEWADVMDYDTVVYELVERSVSILAE